MEYLKLRFFDPTQAFLPDRIQKGLLENLMIKRAELTVYNAQETDTFGKDAEAGVTLAQGKHVVVFVARLFDWLPGLKPLYTAIDNGARGLTKERRAFVGHLKDAALIDEKEMNALLVPDKTKGDAITYVVDKHAPKVLADQPKATIQAELVRHGYAYDATQSGQKPPDVVAAEKIRLLERRAITFRDVHPLSLQTAPKDGVARGVIVTRTVKDTGRVVRGLLLGTLKYDIEEEDANWILRDQITGSPVRVVTKDPILTAAFWDEDWGAPESAE